MRQEDLPVLQSIYLQTRAEKFHWISRSDLDIDDFERDTEGEKIWVAELNGQLVGFISAWEPGNFIHHLFVLPKFSGKKIGSALLSTCLESIGRPAQLKCVSANTDALEFYRAKGWHTISLGVSSDGEFQLMERNET
ncbi:MAG: GNAT family N-acetyltransferase [Gammaproteobacteria bacterium]